MNAKVMDLRPGDKVRMDFDGEQFGVVISVVSPHPLHPHLWLVVWRVYPSRGAPYWSLDALSPFQMVGYYVHPRDNDCLRERLLMALHSDPQAAARVMKMEAGGPTVKAGD